MRVVVAMSPGVSHRDVRQMLLGAGLDCSAEDCVPWDELPTRLAQVQVDAVVLRLTGTHGVDWRVAQEAKALTVAPILAIGPGVTELVNAAQAAGVVEYVDEATLPTGLDEAVQRLMFAGQIRRSRGSVISVFAPSCGSGGTTVACNLAGAFAEKRPKDVALLELSAEWADVGVLLDLSPLHTVEDVCRRHQTLDAIGLMNSTVLHKSGIRALVNGSDQKPNKLLNAQAVRRMAVLSKVAFSTTVLALDSHFGEVEFEAMRLSDQIVLVVRPDVPAVRRAQSAIQEADAQGIPLERFHLVVNRWGQGGQLKIPQIEASLGLKCLQLIPDDPGKVNRAVNKGILLRELSRHSTIYRRFAALAASFSGAGRAKAWSWV